MSRTPERMFEPEDMENLRTLEKRILASVDTGAVVRAHRMENGYLKELDEAIEGLTAVYNSAVHDREPLEGVFVTKIDILLGMARRFHPLSEYGRETLDKAVACRMDFEELAGPLLTRITTDNLASDTTDFLLCTSAYYQFSLSPFGFNSCFTFLIRMP